MVAWKVSCVFVFYDEWSSLSVTSPERSLEIGPILALFSNLRMT